VTVPGLLKVGLVTTSVATRAVIGGYEVRSEARATGVNLLNGLIAADAIDTVTTVTTVDGVGNASAQTTFMNLKIGGVVKMPAKVPANKVIKVLNIATVTLNYALSFPMTASVKRSVSVSR